MMRFLLLSRAALALLLLLLTTAQAPAQLLWQQVMGTKDYDENSAATLAVPGGYLNVGVGGINGPGDEPWHLYLTKTDEAGAVAWQREQRLHTYRGLYARAAAVDATGHVYVTVIGFGGPGPGGGVLVKLTPAGDTLWTRRVPDVGTSFSALETIVLATDGSPVVIGNQGPDSFIAKYSPTGQLLWRRIYVFSAEYPGYLWRVGKLPAGFLVVQSANSGGIPTKYLLLDEEGQLVAEKSGPQFLPFTLRPDRTGNLLVASGSLRKVSPAGEVLWTQSYQMFGLGVSIRLAAETPQGGRYLLAGSLGPFNQADLALLLVDEQGAVLRDTLLSRPFAHEEPTGIAFDAQGNYVIGGYATQGPIGGEDQFILKLRSWDRLLPTATRSATYGLPTAYRLYPNPATTTDEVRVATASGVAFAGKYELRDVAGRVLRSGRTTPGRAISLLGVLPGLYLVRLHDGTHWHPALRLNCL